MIKKCFPSLPSSFASIYLTTSFFAITFFSLLYLKHPHQYINHIDSGIVTLDTTTQTITTPFLIHDLTIAHPPSDSSTNESPPLFQTTQPEFTQLKPPVVNIPTVNPSVDQLPPPVNFPTVKLPTTPATKGIYNNAEDQSQGQISPFDFPNPGGVHIHKDYLAVNQAEEKHDFRSYSHEDEDEDEDKDGDESFVVGYDEISLTPRHFTMEERMEWIKRKIPESKILESTPRTRKFEFKIQRFVRDKQCGVNIYMTWISSTKFFGKREIFSLESIIRAHPHACVIIISRIMATKSGRKIIQPLLDRGHMILTVAPDFPLLFSGTPAQDWFERLKSGQIDPGIISLTQNLSNLLRLVVLYKYGGIYFDTDMIILKDVSRLKNSIGIQVLDPEKKTWLSVNNAVLIFDKGHPLLLKFIDEFNSNFDGNNWGHNGPYLASRVIEQVLYDPNYPFNFMAPMAFYPIGWLEIETIFRRPYANESSWDENMFRKIRGESYGVHLWQNLSRDLKIERGSIVEKLISTHCILCLDVYDS